VWEILLNPCIVAFCKPGAGGGMPAGSCIPNLEVDNWNHLQPFLDEINLVNVDYSDEGQAFRRKN
jgi:hypothetical protein